MTPKKWRKSQNLTLKALSERTGIASGYLSEIENGKKRPSGRAIMAYFEASSGKVKPSDFPKGEEVT